MVEFEREGRTKPSGNNGAGLKICQVIGTSARTSNQFAVRDNIMAYTASGGVVVSQVSYDDGVTTVTSQRFFCANSTTVTDYKQPSHASSANAYLNMAFADLNMASPKEAIPRDLFGYTTGNEPSVYHGSTASVGNDFGKANAEDLDYSSPSKLKERVRSISCIAISPNKRVLAVGETGYQPRILLFSLAANSSRQPFALIYEHSFGINSVTFSPDSRFLCSLGTINDGYIHVWRMTGNSASLQSSNRCSTVINQVVWHDDCIVTLGLRFIKVWRFAEEDIDGIVSKPNALKGKNVILGQYINGNFIDSTMLNDDELLIITADNQLLLLKLGGDLSLSFDLKLIGLEPPLFEFNSIEVDHATETLWFGTDDRSFATVPISDLSTRNLSNISSPMTKTTSRFGSPTKDRFIHKPILKLASLRDQHLIYLSDSEEIVVFEKSTKKEAVLINSLVKNLGGIKSGYSQDLIIFSKSGDVRRLINHNELESVLKFNLPSNDLISNCLSAVESFDDSIVLGDKYGNLTIVELKNENESESGKIVYKTKAHSSTINELIYFEVENNQIVASISRDRMIQFFTKVAGKTHDWDLLQTIPIHNGNLIRIQFHGNKVYACSSDRTVSIHKFETSPDLQLVQEKIISLKASPTNMKLFENDLIVSLNDRTLQIFDITDSYDLKRTLKFINDKNGESLQVENFINYKNSIIVSSTDKSLRVFNYATGRPTCVAWGHSDTILSLELTNDSDLVSIGNDGCLFIWNLNDNNPVEANEQLPVTSNEDVESKLDSEPLYGRVTRKIIPTMPIRSITSKPDGEIRDPSSTESSPTPKLTAATLKRLSVKGTVKSELGSRPSNETVKYTSPVKPMPKISTTATKCSPKSVPLRSQRHSIDATSPVKSLKPPYHYSPPKTYSSPASTLLSDPKIFVDKALSQLHLIESRIKQDKLSAEHKCQLRSKLEAVLVLLTNEQEEEMALQSNTSGIQVMKHFDQEELLERYSDKLLDLFEQKLDSRKHDDNTTSSTPSDDNSFDENDVD